ncbi:MAG TPA: hypothetical protein VMH41_03525 [Mycobacteriales bacterium]|nr:hypothetical protein [Mycobacteriales bacterium]
MIIVEGYDGSGKSTVAEEIGKRLEAPVFHAGGPPVDDTDVLSCAARALTRMNMWCVQDRVTQVSHCVYAMLTKPVEAALAISRMDDLKAARLLVYCRPSTDTILSNLQRHRAKEYEAGHVAKEYAADSHTVYVRVNANVLIGVYDTIIRLASRHVSVIYYDYQNVDFEKFMDYVKRMTRL